MRLGIASYFKMVWFSVECKNLSTDLAVNLFFCTVVSAKMILAERRAF